MTLRLRQHEVTLDAKPRGARHADGSTVRALVREIIGHDPRPASGHLRREDDVCAHRDRLAAALERFDRERARLLDYLRVPVRDAAGDPDASRRQLSVVIEASLDVRLFPLVFGSPGTKREPRRIRGTISSRGRSITSLVSPVSTSSEE